MRLLLWLNLNWLQRLDSNQRSPTHEDGEIGHFSTLRYNGCGGKIRTCDFHLMRVARLTRLLYPAISWAFYRLCPGLYIQMKGNEKCGYVTAWSLRVDSNYLPAGYESAVHPHELLRDISHLANWPSRQRPFYAIAASLKRYLVWCRRW